MVDEAEELVGPATIWLDNRAATTVEDTVEKEHYTAHYERTGTGLTGDCMTDPTEANCIFGNCKTGSFQPDNLDHMGAENCKHLLTPISIQLEDAMAEGRRRMFAATIGKMELYSCAGNARAA